MDAMNQELAPLTNKQQRFVDEYLLDLNAAAAAVRAGYGAKNADVVGSQNLAKPNVAAAIRERMADRRQRTEITQDRVLEELAHIAFARAGDVMEWGETTVRHTEADGEIKETVCHGLKVRKSAGSYGGGGGSERREKRPAGEAAREGAGADAVGQASGDVCGQGGNQRPRRCADCDFGRGTGGEDCGVGGVGAGAEGRRWLSCCLPMWRNCCLI